MFSTFFRKPYKIFITGALLGGLVIVAGIVSPVRAVVVEAAHTVARPFHTAAALISTKVLHQSAALSASAQAALSRPASDYEAAVVDAVKKASPAVVSIVVSKDVPIIEQCPVPGGPFSELPPEFPNLFGDGINGGEFPQLTVPCTVQGKTTLQEVGGGSGFIISTDGFIATNKHVVDDKSASYTVFTNDGKKYAARVVAYDPAQDLAIVKIDASGLPTVTLGDSDAAQLGQTSIAIGNALGEFRNTVSVGVISGLSRNITASGGRSAGGSETIQGVIQTDAAINPGNSGGPLLNLRGEVIGINTAVAQGAQNIGFAIPINQAKRDITSVKQSGTIQAPYLGVHYLTVTPAVAQQKSLPLIYGALVGADQSGAAVASNSPAASAGIRDGDLIYQMNDQVLDADHPLSQLIANAQVGDRITLLLYRDGKQLSVTATLTVRPQ